VTSSLTAAKAAREHAISGAYHATADAARKARGLAEAAFFQPSIMSLLYFPAEHQLAIYTVHTHNAQSLTADERNIYVFPQNKLLREQIAVLGRSFLDLLIEFVVWIPV
jgi:hypothetical protein